LEPHELSAKKQKIQISNNQICTINTNLMMNETTKLIKK